MKLIVSSLFVIGVLLVLGSVVFARPSGEVKQSPLYQQSLQESIAQIQGKTSPNAAGQLAVAANFPTSQSICPAVPQTEQNTCSSTYCNTCGGPTCSATCYSTCTNTCNSMYSTCASTCANTCARIPVPIPAQTRVRTRALLVHARITSSRVPSIGPTRPESIRAATGQSPLSTGAFVFR